MTYPRLLLSLAGAALLASASGAPPARAAGGEADRAAADALVRGTYYEGLPYEEARALGPEGAGRLREILGDEGASSLHANALLALGIAARPGAFEAIEAYAKHSRRGEVDGATYRALLQVPIAMGHLARSDARALAWLDEHAIVPGSDPGWSHGPLRGTELGRLLRQQALSGLALSGRAEAAQRLRLLARAPRAAARARPGAEEPDVSEHAAWASGLCDRIRTEGPAAVLGSRGRRTSP